MKVLIVEDNEDSCAVMVSAMTSLGYGAMSCANGVEALSLARATPPDLIISDIMMPYMDGFELCRHTKADPELKEIPFIFYSATYTEQSDIELAMALGASRYLIKPLEMEEIVEAIQEVMSTNKAGKLQVSQGDIKGKNELEEMHLHSIGRKLDEKVRMLEQEREALTRSEDKLKKLMKQLSQAQKIAHLGSWESDSVNDKLDCSDEMYRIFEFAPKVIGQSCKPFYKAFVDTIHPDDREYVFSAYTASVRNRRDFDMEYRLLMKDGRIKYVNERRETTYNSNGRVLRSLGIVLDITERKQSEKEREKLQVQLTKTQKMESVGRVASGVVHDFNNMISIIIGFAELALMKMGPSHPLFADLQEIRKTGERSASLTRQLMSFVRKQKTVPKVTDLNEMVEEIVNLLRQLAGQYIKLTWLPGADLWQIKIDPVQIDQIMTNLCANARDAISGKGNITIETENVVFDEVYCTEYPEFVAGEFVMLYVRDDGCGMDGDVLENLFEPFFTTKGESLGTGLGLSTVYGIVKQNDGFISIDSEHGKGTIFKIYLPRFTNKSEPVQEEGLLETVSRGNETVLLVDDAPLILESITKQLEHLGYTVLTATTPDMAIRLFEEYAGQVHLLVTDVIMPKMNGWDLSNELLSRNSNLKSLFMSGHTTAAIGHMGVLGEDAYFIQKPFTSNAIVSKVREVLDRK
ncbi:MAG: response regulator [Gammaproteobacteria bacterium]|nr:response regulator [Gammaproteobacteria bacterium]